MITLPSLHRLMRPDPTLPGISDLSGEVRRVLTDAKLDPKRLAGKRIALTVGSRGIASLQTTVRAICDWLKEQKAQPFVIPAMGSHGGATDEGQREVLREYGVTEELVGAPVHSSMQTVLLTTTPEGSAVYMDRLAHEADGVIVFNRIKPHPGFHGRVESGWMKVMTVGMGKEDGAKSVHLAARQQGYEPAIRSIGQRILESGCIVGAVGVIENEEHQVAAVRAARPENLVETEEKAQELSKKLLGRLPFSQIGLLIVDELGKDVSGSGMDFKVIGRGITRDPDSMPEIRLIYVRDITSASGGNGVGVGMADLIHEQLYRKLDLKKVYVNARAALEPSGARVPMFFPSDANAIEFALSAMGSLDVTRERIVWIQNTLLLKEILVSPGILPELKRDAGYREVPASVQPSFHENGDLSAPWNGLSATA